MGEGVSLAKNAEIKWKRDFHGHSRLSLDNTYTVIRKFVSMRDGGLQQRRVHAKLPQRGVTNPVVVATKPHVINTERTQCLKLFLSPARTLLSSPS